MMAVDRAPVRVVGRYALYNEIAAGGMATIHLGRLLGPVGFARTVAVKRLHPQFAKDPEFVSMFLDEARLAARVQHPNVVATIDVVATDGELFLIMDYVRGESLSKIVRTCRKQKKLVPPRIAAAIMCGFLHGLHAAHEAKDERGAPLNLVHRDVSPQNVLVGADGVARVLDFGIAKAQGRIQVTRDGQIKGKLAYMPPEQLAGRELTRAVDIYASAVVMWETLTGERLFKGETEAATLAKILREPVSAPSVVEPSVPKEFDAPLLKALSRDVQRRHPTAKDLARELERCVGMATPTEVGEWVEGLVGGLLSAREDQIAQIESMSANLTALQETSTDSVPSADAIRRVLESGPTETLPMGSGPPSARGVSLRRDLEGGGQSTQIIPGPYSTRGAPGTQSGAYPAASRPSFGSLNTGRIDEVTQSGNAFTRMLTGTLTLPMDRKLPILASAAGVLVLVLVVGVVLAGKFSAEDGVKRAAAAPAATTKPTPPSDSASSPTSDV
ncbi:MAG TPA: serine/threonine-protein kinase, partial [Labilithrix sp.]|nr:serine/threonine-protein kinase [Labilithrix sp.]